MAALTNLCVFCGSSPGKDPTYTAAARQLGEVLAGQRIALVYGGGNVGLMGVIADAVLQAGGRAVGVIPQALVARELAHDGLQELRVVNSMHERQAMMAELADGFVALPGGIGTLEELFEILTWAQLGIHSKPCGILNVSNYYDGLLQFFDYAVAERFVKPKHRAMLLVDSDPQALLQRMSAFTPPRLDKWIDRSRT